MHWQQWAGAVINGNPKSPIPAALRVAATDALLEQLASPAGEGQLGHDLNHELLNIVVAVDRETLEQEKANSTTVYSASFGAFVLHAVQRNVGGQALLVENLLVDQLSLVISEDVRSA